MAHGGFGWAPAVACHPARHRPIRMLQAKMTMEMGRVVATMLLDRLRLWQSCAASFNHWGTPSSGQS